MEIHNQDIFPPDEMLALFEACRPVVVNPLIDGAFLDHERKAVNAKRSYHYRGRLAILLVLGSVLFTVAEALIVPSAVPAFRALSLIAVVIGMVGFAIQVYLLMTGAKKVWLVNRFAAERLRSIKFQAYQFAYLAVSAEDFAARVNAFYAAELARLNAELNAGEAALGIFSPNRSITKVASPKRPAAPLLAEVMERAYEELRISYQLRYAEAEIRNLQARRRVGYAAADLLYLLGAALTLAALTSKLFFPYNEALARWIDFFAIVAFIIGLSLTIFENASLAESSIGRYEDYVRALEARERELSEGDASFPETVRQIERVVLGELSQFCLAASQISYRL